MTTTIIDLENEYHILDRELYELSQERHRVASAFRSRIKALFANLPLGLRHFALSALAAPDARYVHVDLRGPRGGYSNGARLSYAVYRVVQIEGEPDACVQDEATGAIAGRLCPEVFSWGDGEKGRTPPWRALRWAADHDILLPLAGEMLMQHPPMRAIADLARQVTCGGPTELAEIRTIDRKVEQLLARQTDDHNAAHALAVKDIDIPALEQRHAAIITMMKGHDWTWREADQWYERCSDHEDRLFDVLRQIPEPEAAALWYLHAPTSYMSWTSAQHRLAQKPPAKKQAA
jgi:hypothetical protein